MMLIHTYLLFYRHCVQALKLKLNICRKLQLKLKSWQLCWNFAFHEICYSFNRNNFVFRDFLITAVQCCLKALFCFRFQAQIIDIMITNFSPYSFCTFQEKYNVHKHKQYIGILGIPPILINFLIHTCENMYVH